MAGNMSNRKKQNRKENNSFPMYRTVVLGRAVDLHRNLANTIFPERLSGKQLTAVRDKILETLLKVPELFRYEMRPALFGDNDFSKLILSSLPCGFINKSFMEKDRGGALVADGDDVIMRINDEDHIVFMRVSNASESFEDMWWSLDTASRKLEKYLPFAKNFEYGYLTPNPENVGTGLRLATCFSFLGLYLMGELEQVLCGLERLGFEVRPMVSIDGVESGNAGQTAAPGYCYRVSTTQTVGHVEDLIERADRIFAEIALQEQNARLRLVNQKIHLAQDFFFRSVAVASVAVTLSEYEALDILYSIVYGIDMGFLEAPDVDFDELLELTFCGFEMFGEDIEGMDGDLVLAIHRAAILRNVSRPFMKLCLDYINELDGLSPKGKKKRGKNKPPDS
jgi:protein-arginine kinase